MSYVSLFSTFRDKAIMLRDCQGNPASVLSYNRYENTALDAIEKIQEGQKKLEEIKKRRELNERKKRTGSSYKQSRKSTKNQDSWNLKNFFEGLPFVGRAEDEESDRDLPNEDNEDNEKDDEDADSGKCVADAHAHSYDENQVLSGTVC